MKFNSHSFSRFLARKNNLSFQTPGLSPITGVPCKNCRPYKQSFERQVFENASIQVELQLLKEQLAKSEASLAKANDQIRTMSDVVKVEKAKASSFTVLKEQDGHIKLKLPENRRAKTFAVTVNATTQYSAASSSSRSRRVDVLGKYLQGLCGSDNANDIADCLGKW